MGKGLGHTQGGGCAPSGCQGVHVCARVCARVCSCQWQRPLFLPTYLQSQRSKTVSEAEGPFATVTVTVKDRVPGALSTDGSHPCPPAPGADDTSPSETSPPPRSHSEAPAPSISQLGAILEGFLGEEPSNLDSKLTHRGEPGQRHDPCKPFHVQGGLTAHGGERSPNSLQSTVLLGSSETSRLPSPSHPSPTFSARPYRRKASNPALAMRLWAVSLLSDPCRCWGKLRLSEAPELRRSPRMGRQRTWPGQGSRPLVGEPRAWQSQGMEAPPLPRDHSEPSFLALEPTSHMSREEPEASHFS